MADGMIIAFTAYENRIRTVGVTVVNTSCCFKNIHIDYLMFIWHEIYVCMYVVTIDILIIFLLYAIQYKFISLLFYS